MSLSGSAQPEPPMASNLPLHVSMLIPSPRKVVGLSALILAGLFWCGLAEAQALRCVDPQGNVSYRDAGGRTGGGCTPLNQQALRTPRGESRDAATGDQKQLCTGTLTSSLFAPDTARFTLWPSGPSVLAGYVDAPRSEEHTSELQSQSNLVCRLLLEK